MAFFVIIPVKGNKYYKPVNRNYFSRPLKIHPIIIRPIPWRMQMKFCVIPYNSYGVKIACFWPLFSCKDTGGMPQPFSLLLHRPECENGCQHWCILWIEFDFDFWNQIFEISDFNAILNLCNHPDPKAPRLVVRQAAPVRGAVSILCNLIGPRCLCQISLANGAAWSLMRGLCWNHRFRPSCACVLPVVRDAGPLLEPLVPPLVRLRAALRRRPCPAGGAHDFQIFIIHTLYGS